MSKKEEDIFLTMPSMMSRRLQGSGFLWTGEKALGQLARQCSGSIGAK